MINQWGQIIKTTYIPTPLKDFKVFKMTMSDLYSLLSSANISTPMGMLDNAYYYTDETGWKLILTDLVTNSSLYIVDKFDCEDFAIKAKSIANSRYGLNTVGFVIGDIPQGRHGFNLIVTTTGLLLFEPQNNVANFGVFPLGARNYHADVVLI